MVFSIKALLKCLPFWWCEVRHTMFTVFSPLCKSSQPWQVLVPWLYIFCCWLYCILKTPLNIFLYQAYGSTHNYQYYPRKFDTCYKKNNQAAFMCKHPCNRRTIPHFTGDVFKVFRRSSFNFPLHQMCHTSPNCLISFTLFCLGKIKWTSKY